MASVGLIGNPSASRDVRRLTSLARTIDVHERANAVARVLCGLAGGGVELVWYMPDPTHVVEGAGEALPATPAAGGAAGAPLSPPLLGGAARGWPGAAPLPLAGGTNNAFPPPLDPTAAGLAAALYAADPARHDRHVVRRPRLAFRLAGPGRGDPPPAPPGG